MFSLTEVHVLLYIGWGVQGMAAVNLTSPKSEVSISTARLLHTTATERPKMALSLMVSKSLSGT